MRNFLLCILLFTSSCVYAEDFFSLSVPQGPYGVGLHVVQQSDFTRSYASKIDLVSGKESRGERARPIQTLVWYPAQADGKPVIYSDYVKTAVTEVSYSMSDAEINHQMKAMLDTYAAPIGQQQIDHELAKPMWARQDAKPVDGKFPIVIYAPSFSAPAAENADLCEFLASQGYVVLASADMGAHGRGMTIDLEGVEAQASDIEYLIGYAHSLPQANAAHIAVVGYSWGGISNVFAAAKDNRISALVSLDGTVRYFPALVVSAKYVTPDRLAIPFLYLASRPMSLEDLARRKQDMTVSFLNRMKYSDLYKVTMYPMDHIDFSSQSLRFEPNSSFVDYSREEVLQAHNWMIRYVHQFLNAYLKNDAAGLAFLNNSPTKNAVPAHTLKIDVHHAEGLPPNIELLAKEIGERGYKHTNEIYQELLKRDAEFKPAEEKLEYWGYDLLSTGKVKESIEISKLAVTLYPESNDALDSLAYSYETNHDNTLAIENYKRSLALAPNDDNATQHLKILGAATKDGKK